MYGDGHSGMDVFGLLDMRSVDTLATLAERQTQLEAMGETWRVSADGGMSTARVFAAPNLHKVPGGMIGYATELGGNIRVQHLQPTEQLFEGITFARCVDSNTLHARLSADGGKMRAVLQAFNHEWRGRTWGERTLLELMPSAQTDRDFWWHGQEAVHADTRSGHMHMVSDMQRGEHNYYNLYQSKLDGAADTGHDLALRDSAGWECRLTGYVSLVQQLGCAEPAFYLVCRSGMPELAGPLVMALKNDLNGEVSACEYADSKECWFLRNINHRNRCRLLALAAKAMGLKVETSVDTMATPSEPRVLQAKADIEVLLEDLYTCNVLAPEENDAAPMGTVLRAPKLQRVARHVRGCVDAHATYGPLTLELGGAQGFAVFTHEPVATVRLHECTGPAIPSHSTREIMLFPTLNMHDACAADIQSVDKEAARLPTLRIHDILYSVSQMHTRLPPRVRALLNAMDCDGYPLVYGKQYPGGLPTVLLPCHPLSHTSAHMEQQESAFDELPMAQLLPVKQGGRAFSQVSNDSMLQELVMDVKITQSADARGATAATDACPTRQCIEFDDHALARLCALALPHYDNICAARLVPCLGALPAC